MGNRSPQAHEDSTHRDSLQHSHVLKNPKKQEKKADNPLSKEREKDEKEKKVNLAIVVRMLLIPHGQTEAELWQVSIGFRKITLEFLRKDTTEIYIPFLDLFNGF